MEWPRIMGCDRWGIRKGEAEAGATASAVIGKPGLPALPDITG